MKLMTFVYADDWVGVYIDGDLATEGHQIEPEDAVEITIEEQVTDIFSGWVDEDWLYNQENLPKHISEVKWYKE